MAQNNYPSIKQLKEVLGTQGLTEEEFRGVSIIDNEENDRVGFAWRGRKLTIAMQGIEESLQLRGIAIRFSKIEEEKGTIYISKLKG